MSARIYPPSDVIIVERREIVATIEPGSGTQSMITAAYHAIGEYLSEHDDMTGVDISFLAFGRTFRASLDADAAVPKPR